jgi:ATP-binding cassette, subfamily B, bacterial PglK
LVFTMLGQGRDAASLVPTLGLFAAAAFRLMPSVNRMLASIQGIRFGLPAIDSVHRELSMDAGTPHRDQAQPISFEREVVARAVSFTYPGKSTPALDGVSLFLRKGQSLGLIGPSGSGKSTLVDVMLGLLPAQSGEILVDGVDIRSNLRGWQNLIGYVPQTIYLTDDTLRRNIAFGVPSSQIDEAAVDRAIRLAQLEDFVLSLDLGLDTVVGERGVRLSGGQRQRIGIARALYHDPPVLVLDEATSALDTDTERGVMQAVTALHGSKTVLVVAHRLSTLEHCDEILELRGGMLVASRMESPGITKSG